MTERESALLKQNNKEEKEILPFVTQYQLSVSSLKEVLMKKWNLIQNQPLLRQIFKEPPIISYKKGKSLKDMLVRAKIYVRAVTPCIFSGKTPVHVQENDIKSRNNKKRHFKHPVASVLNF